MVSSDGEIREIVDFGYKKRRNIREKVHSIFRLNHHVQSTTSRTKYYLKVNKPTCKGCSTQSKTADLRSVYEGIRGFKLHLRI